MVDPVGTPCSTKRVGRRRSTLIGFHLLLALLGTASVQAQLPATRLAAVFPPGGKQGSEVALTLTQGTDLEGVNRLWFSHPGITATQKMQTVEGQPQPQPVANQFQVKIAPDVPVGIYELRAVGSYGISNPRAFSVGDRGEVSEIEPNQAPEQATEIAVGTWINGRSDAAKDVDFFRFAAKAGERIIIDAWAERIDSRMDTTIELFDSAGKLLRVGRDFNHHDSLLDFSVPADGEYRLKVYDFQYAGGQEHFYRLGISTAPYLDFVFPPAGVPGTKGSFTIYGRNLPGGTPADGLAIDGRPLERLAVEIDLPGDPVARQRLTFDGMIDAPMAGMDGLTYRIGGPAGNSNPALITYATAPVVLEQEPNDTGPQVVMPPCECAGQFGQPNDQDTFSFQAKKDEVFWIEVYSQRIGAPTDPLLIIQQVTKDEKGQDKVTELKAEDDSAANIGGQSFNTTTTDPTFRLACPADGEYRVTVRDLYSETRGAPNLRYRLAIRREQLDFRLVALADFPINGQAAPNVWTNFLRKGGTDMLRVLAMRQDGFGGEIVVSVEGLPEGVTCPPATMGPGQSSAMLVFSAAENAADWVGAIKLVGRAKIGDAEFVREVRPAAVMAAGLNRPGISRLTRDLALAVGQLAPYLVQAETPQLTIPQSQWITVPLKGTRRGDFQGVLALTTVGIPANVQNEAVNLAADQTAASLYLFAQADAPPGTYTVYVQSTTQVPFTKNAEGKDKQPVNVVDASTPITVTILPGALVLAPQVPNNGNVKQGGSLEIPVTVTRRAGFAGPITLDLFLPPGTAGIEAAAVTIPADQNQGKLVMQVAADATEGARPHVAARGRIEIDGKPVELVQPIAINVQK